MKAPPQIHWIDKANHGMAVKGRTTEDVMEEINAQVFSWLRENIELQHKWFTVFKQYLHLAFPKCSKVEFVISERCIFFKHVFRGLSVNANNFSVWMKKIMQNNKNLFKGGTEILQNI